MALVLHKLQLEGVQIEPYVRIVQNSAEIVRATLRCRGGLLSLERLSAVGFDVTQDGSLEILVSAGISGDLLLGSLHLRSMLFRTPHGRLECRGIGPPGVQMSFDYVYQPLEAGTGAFDIDDSLVHAILQTNDAMSSKDVENLTFLFGNMYEGDRHGLAMNGQGLYSWKDEGAVFRGEFKDNMPAGRGEYVWSDGSTYTGGIARGQREGVGVFAFADNTYHGDWIARRRHGRGRLESKDGHYDGEWADHVKEGYGEMLYANGNRYTGSWSLDAKSGSGTMEWYDRQEKYTGEWRCGLQHGEGEHIWLRMQDMGTPFQVRERYCGHWENGERHGLGRFYYANGSSYMGMWQANKKHGKGAFTFEDGTVFEGVFVHDRMADGIVLAATEMPAHLTGTTDDDAHRVQNLLVRHDTRVRQIYWYYTQLGCDQEEAFEMSIEQFHQFVLDANLCSSELSLAQIHRVVFPSSYSLSAQLPRNNQLCSAVRLRPLLQRSTPENGQVLDADTGSLVQREFIQCLVSMAALVQPSKDGLAEQLRSMLMNHLLPLALTNEDQVHIGSRTPAFMANALLLLYTFYCKEVAAPRFDKAQSRNALTVRALLKLLRDADIVTDYTNVAELLLIILPAHYCSSLASACTQQQVVGASESIERKAVLLEEAGGMPLQQTDAFPEKKNHDGNIPDEEEHTQHTEAKVFKILDDATRDAFERLLDIELLFAEFQQAYSALATSKVLLVQTDVARSERGCDHWKEDGLQCSTDCQDEAIITSTSKAQLHQNTETGGGEVEDSQAAAMGSPDAERHVLLLNDVILPRIFARLDGDLKRLQKAM